MRRAYKGLDGLEVEYERAESIWGLPSALSLSRKASEYNSRKEGRACGKSFLVLVAQGCGGST